MSSDAHPEPTYGPLPANLGSGRWPDAKMAAMRQDFLEFFDVEFPLVVRFLMRTNPKRFRQFLAEVETEVEHSVRRARLRPWPGAHRYTQPWRFSGTADLISFMVYKGKPDWASLRAIQLCGTTAPQLDQYPLGRVVEGLRRWQEEDPDPTYAPGEAPELGPLVPREALRQALLWSAFAAASGFIGNRADAILTHLLH